MKNPFAVSRSPFRDSPTLAKTGLTWGTLRSPFAVSPTLAKTGLTWGTLGTWATLCFLAFLLAGVAGATSVIPMSVEELTRAADAVVEAQAADSWTLWNPQHTIIFTYTRFVVQKSLKGSLPEQIVVKQPGGVVGDHAMRVPGVRAFQGGETVLLFLRPSAAADGSQVVVGLMQGNFRMYKTAAGEVAVSNGVPGISAVQNGVIRGYSGTAMSLRDMETRIQGAK